MARGVNKVILVGNLGRDPEVRYSPNGQAVANVTLATSESWKDKTSGEKQERTEWHRIVFFGRLAEIAGEYLKKGAQIYVEGSIRTSEWTDKEGQKKTSYEINASTFRMLGSRSDSMGGGAARSAAAGSADFDAEAPAPAEHEQAGPEVTDEDIPF